MTNLCLKNIHLDEKTATLKRFREVLAGGMNLLQHSPAISCSSTKELFSSQSCDLGYPVTALSVGKHYARISDSMS